MVVNGDAPWRVALWFGVTRVNGVLSEQRPSNCLTCPSDDCGEVFDGVKLVSLTVEREEG